VSDWSEIASQAGAVRENNWDRNELWLISRAGVFCTSLSIAAVAVGLVLAFPGMPSTVSHRPNTRPLPPIRRRAFRGVQVNRRKEETQAGDTRPCRRIGGAGSVVRTAARDSGDRQVVSKAKHRVVHLHARIRRVDGRVTPEEPRLAPAVPDQPTTHLCLKASVLGHIVGAGRGPPSLEHTRFLQSGAQEATRLSCFSYLSSTKRTSAHAATAAVGTKLTCFA
jgi:hypothetical protein